MKKHAKHRQLVKSNQAQPPVATFNKKAILFYVSMMFASNTAHANPTGGEFAAGAGAISTLGNLTTVQQNTQRAIVNWQSFGTNAGEAVKFMQPSANAAILNRVVGNLPSNLNGLLEGNGRVYLINPNGIVLGQNGVINVNGGFVASTQNISDSAFMQGGALLFTGENTGNIQILGKIQSAQGDIVIIAPKTEIAAGAELKAGQSIQLIAANEVRLSNGKFTVTPKLGDAGQLTVAGTLEAAKVQLEAHNNNLGALAINTTGTIRASGTQTNPDGSVTIMAYGEGSNIKVSGNISAQNNDASQQGGRIIVGRNEETGELAKSADVSGARFTTNKGFVETSGDYLVTTGTRVLAKDWLLDPYNITITSSVSGTSYSDPNGTGGNYSYAPGATSSIKASDIEASLNDGTNVKISTGTGSTGDAGNITVAANINKSAGNAATLTLEANNNITFNSNTKITDTGSGNLGVHLIANGASANGASIYMKSGSAVDVVGSLVLDATAKTGGGINNSAIYMALGSLNQAENNSGTRTLLRGSDVTLNMTLSGANQWGLFTEHATGIQATTGNVNITATYGNTSSSGMAVFMGSGWNGSYNPATEYVKASNGAITIQSSVTGTNADGKLNFAGTTLSAKNDITLKANITDPTQTAILVKSEFNSPKIQSSTGDILIQSNTGGVSVTALTAGAISGKNITIDNTGSTLASRDSSGNYTKGSGAFTATSGAAVNIQGSGAGIQATGNLDIIGVSNASSSSGVVQTGTDISGSRVSIQGENLGTGLGRTNGFYNTGTITSTGTDVYIRGASQKDNALSLQGAITAKTDATLIGAAGDGSNTATSWGVYLNKAVTAQTGNISLTGSTTSTNAGVPDVKLDSGANLLTSGATGTKIKVAADTLDIHTSAASINAGTNGTVTISNNTAGTKIDLGGSNAIASNGVKTLGLNKAQLDRVTAATTTIGSDNAGDITVSAATTTATNTGNITLQTGGNIAVNAVLTVGDDPSTSGVVEASKNLTLNGASTQSAAIKAAGLELLGDNATHTLTNTGNTVGTLAANTKKVDYTNSTRLIVGAVNSTTGIKTQTGVSVTTQTGNLVINEAINNQTSGNVIVGAGITGSAGELSSTSSGDVKTASGKGITHTNGNLYVYSGSAVNTGLLSHLDDTLGDLKVTGVATGADAQNTDTYFAYNNGAGISIGGTSSTATAQVMFREKVTINANDLVGTTVNDITYGDLATETSSEGQTNLLNKTLTKLKEANSSNYETNPSGTNNIKIAKSVVIDSLSGSLENPSVNSTGNLIKATTSGAEHQYGALSSGKYNASIAAGAVKVQVDKKAITITGITADNKVYDGTTAATVNTTNAAGWISGDEVTVSATGAFDNKNVGTGKTVTLSSTIGGADAGNYSITNQTSTTADVTAKAITITGITADNKVYDGTTAATVNTTNAAGWISGDEVTVSATGAFDNKNVGTGKTVTLSSTIGGADAGNYSITNQTSTTADVTAKAITISANGNTVFYNGQLQTDTVTNSGLVTGDNADIVGAGSGTAEGVYQSNLSLAGGDAGNYAVTVVDRPFTIKVNTPSAYRYTPSSSDAVTLTPITFGFGVAGGATAAGGDVEGSCDAWSQRAGAGSVSVMSLLKPNYMGLRNAKTDNMDAMSGGQASGASASEEANPCANAAQVERQAKL